MQEALFSNSPTDLILSIVGFILVVAFPFTISQKTKVRQLPRALQQFVATLLIWNFAHIIGDAVIGTANSPAAYILFGIQAMAWIQAGDSSRHVAEISFVARRTPLWRIKHIVAEICVITATVMFCINQEWMVQTFGIPFLGLEQHPAFVVYGMLFMIFVVPDLALTFYTMLRRSLHMSDQTLVQINVYMLTAFGFFVLFPLTLDFIIPLAYNFQNSPEPVTFLQWFQYCTIFIAILCGQYFTSVSFKNKSAWWFLNGFVRYMGDCVVYFDSKGHILFANPASQQIFQLSDSDIATVNVQQLLPDIDTQQEATYTNVKVKIKNELHTFNVGIFKLKQSLTTSVNVLLLSDQTNLLFYQQRIKTLNRQFTEYKQDLIRYQERLDISEKRSKETENINATLINALPFQFWSKNENGVYLTQNIKDVTMRGNLNKTTDAPDSIKVEEIEAREDGRSKIFTTFEDADHNEISEEEASINIKNDKQIYVYQNHFIPIIVNRPSVSSGMSEDKNGGSGYSFTTESEASYADLVITIKPSAYQDETECNHANGWKNCREFIVEIDNNDTLVFEDFELRLYLGAKADAIAPASDIKHVFDGKGKEQMNWSTQPLPSEHLRTITPAESLAIPQSTLEESPLSPFSPMGPV